MIVRRVLFCLALICALCLSASGPRAQLTTTGAGGSGGGGVPVVACSAGQLDFSDGCNTTQYMVLLK